ncbi:MAG: beta-ketoacyl-ACP synthase III [Eubacteriales bacterium]|nr:beta-ketoacyl-ACP synthase III [Eubacteriales bacterium]
MFSKIIASGAFIPKVYKTNDMLAEIMDTNDEWIKSRTGISTRHISEDKDVFEDDKLTDRLLYMSAKACEEAICMAEQKNTELRESGDQDFIFDRNNIDFVIAATSTGDYLFPSLSCRLQDSLGIKRAGVMDISLACTGFLAALQTADAYIKAGMYKNVLVVGADIMSRIVDWSDRNTGILFGDAAGAVIVSGDIRWNRGRNSDIVLSNLISDGSGDLSLYCRAMYFNESDKHSIKMDGRRVFEFAVKKVPEAIRLVIDEAENRIGEKIEPKYYVLHQANLRIIEAVARRLKKDKELFPHNIEKYANTTAATIPVLLDELNRGEKIKEGDYIVCAGFGAGLSYGASLIRW